MSTESENPITQEQELWARISTTTGAERADVLDELSHFAFKKNNYIECLQLLETSIELYESDNPTLNTSKLEHVYEGKALCHANLQQHAEAAATFQILANLYKSDEKQPEFLNSQRASARAWFEAGEWQKCLDGHSSLSQEIDPDSDLNSQGIDLLNIGMALAKLNRHPEAIEKFRSARQLFKSDKDPEMVNWCDRYLADSYTELHNGIDAHYHAQHFFNYAKVTEDLDMESYARYRLGRAHWLLKEYAEAEKQFVRSLELLTLDETKDWTTISKANNELAAALFAQGKNDHANEILTRIATIEETLAS